MRDLAALLRSIECKAGCGTMSVCVCSYAGDAADEIEQLRTGLRDTRDVIGQLRGSLAEAGNEVAKLREQLGNKNEHLNWIRGYADLMTPDNWRDMRLRIKRQVEAAFIDEQGK